MPVQKDQENSIPAYYVIIPASVRYDNRINPCARLLYGEITALCNNSNYCFESNQYFADLYNVSRETVSRWISSLKDFGYISVVIEDNNTRKISINENT